MDFHRKLLPILFCFLLVTRSSFGTPLPMFEGATHIGQVAELAAGGMKGATVGVDAARAGATALDAAKVVDVGSKAETIKAGATGAETLSEMRGAGSAAHGLEDAGHFKDAAAGHALAEGGEMAKGGEAAKALEEAKAAEAGVDGGKPAVNLAAGSKEARARLLAGFKKLKGLKMKDVAKWTKVKVFGEENKVMSNLVGKDVTDIEKAEKIWNGMSDQQKLEKVTNAVRAIEDGKALTNERELATMSEWLDGAGKSNFFDTVAHGSARFKTLSVDMLKVVKADKAARAKGLFATAFRIIKLPFRIAKNIAKSIVSKIVVEIMYKVHPSSLAPEVRAAMMDKKAQITEFGWFARLVGANPIGWTPELQAARQAGGFAVSPAGKALARAKAFLRGAETAKEGETVADGTAHVAKGADATEAALEAEKAEDAAGAGIGTAGTVTHVAEGSGGFGKTAAQQVASSGRWGEDARLVT